MRYTLDDFVSNRREAFNAAEHGEEVLIVRHGAIFALISVELALKNQPLAQRQDVLPRLDRSPDKPENPSS